MHIAEKQRDWVRWATDRRRDIGFLGAIFALAGCASPGPPLPPTLNLPQIVSAGSLTAVRVGDEVRLHWTTPAQTTDKLPIKGAIVAEICRDVVAVSRPTRSQNAQCPATTRVNVATGASDAVDLLPASLTAGPARTLSYRVQLLNAAGRTAGPSPAVFAAAGQGAGSVQGFAGSLTKAGVELRWKANSGGGGRGTVELDRTLMEAAASAHPAKGQARKNQLPGTETQAAETRFRAGAGGAGDPGGAVDRTVEIGRSYSYTAQRVDVVQAGGHVLEIRSVPSAALAFTVRDDFPPDVPTGLVAVPGFVGGVGGEAQRPTIDLSWEPDVEARMAGYRVYRREVGADHSGAWVRLDSQLVMTAAYRDLTVLPGHTYAYRVTALGTMGNESAPSAEAGETAATD